MNLSFASDPEPQKHTNEELYEKQMALLKTFLERKAISREQYEKSTHDLTEKMKLRNNRGNTK